jgi:hypothetical protein
MTRVVSGRIANGRLLDEIGLSAEVLKAAISQTYDLLDKIDQTLTSAGVFPLSQTVELANLSSMIGNIFGAAIAQHSKGLFRRNGPHKFPDLLSVSPTEWPDLEIKMALEGNKPKGHLAKPGYYITCRYVLCDLNGKYEIGKAARGITPYIWEVRCGLLEEAHFNISNTAGDSGKTAVVNAAGMLALKIVYVDIERAPLSKRGRVFSEYAALVASGN